MVPLLIHLILLMNEYFFGKSDISFPIDAKFKAVLEKDFMTF